MLVLDEVSPLERVKLSAELASKVKLLSGDVGALQRVSASARVAAILRELGVGSSATPYKAGQDLAPTVEFPIKEAASSYSGISHSGGARAQGDKDEYERNIAQEVAAAEPLVETPEQRAALAAAELQLRSDYISQYRSLMGVRAGTYSGHIAGRSKLNSKQANSRNSSYDKALDRFTAWFKANTGRIKAAVLAARSPEQLAAAQAAKDAEQAAKDAKSAESARKNVEFMAKLLSFKAGDDLKLGNSVITKVNKDRAGNPTKLTFVFADGSKPFDDKIDLLRVLYRGDKAAMQRDVEAAQALLSPAGDDPAEAPSIDEQINQLLDEYLALQRRKYAHTMKGNERGAEVAAQYALDDMRVQVRRNKETAGGEAMALEVLADEVAYSREKIDELLSAAATEAEKADGKSRAVAGGQEGINGYTYKGGQFLPNTMAEPGRWKLNDKWVTAGKEQVAPGEWEFAPTPFSRSIYMASGLSVYGEDAGAGALRLRPGLRDSSGESVTLDSEVRPGVRGVLSRTAFTMREMLSAYNQGLRWVEVEPDAETITTQDAAELAKAVAKFKDIAARNATAESEAPADPGTESLEIIEHVTGKGKTIRGIVRTDLSHAEAKAIDEYTFKKNGGWFIREKHLPGFAGETAKPAVVKQELPPEQQAQIEADRLADHQLREQQKRVDQVSKLRAAAESTIEKAEAELGANRQTNTARRAAMASSITARHEAARAIGKTMMNLADAIESGDAKHLAGITSRAAVETLHERLVQGMYEADRAANMSYSEQERQKGRAPTVQDAQHAKFPFPQWGSAGTSLAKVLDAIKGKKGSVELAKKIRFSPGPDAEVLRALKAMLPAKEFNYLIGWWNIEQVAKVERLRRAGINNDADLRAALVEYLQFREGARQEDPIKKAERAIIGQKVGIDFFPTPVATASRMADLARIGKGDRVLEPSAGNGNLADAAKSKGAEVDVLEISSQLRDILKAKGYNVVDHDFETFEPERKYDAVIMNPPFSSRKDAEHIQRAFGMLKPGGRLVAIAGEGVFIGSDAKAVQFRSWLDQHGAEVEALEKNTFQDKNLLATTGANGRLIVLTR